MLRCFHVIQIKHKPLFDLVLDVLWSLLYVMLFSTSSETGALFKKKKKLTICLDFILTDSFSIIRHSIHLDQDH